MAYGYSTDVSHTGGRLISVTYPSGSVIAYNYGTANGLNDVISRLDSMSEGNTTLECYKYLGLSTVVERISRSHRHRRESHVHWLVPRRRRATNIPASTVSDE